LTSPASLAPSDRGGHGRHRELVSICRHFAGDSRRPQAPAPEGQAPWTPGSPLALAFGFAPFRRRKGLCLAQREKSSARRTRNGGGPLRLSPCSAHTVTLLARAGASACNAACRFQARH
jgi:hypothetical protein